MKLNFNENLKLTDGVLLPTTQVLARGERDDRQPGSKTI